MPVPPSHPPLPSPSALSLIGLGAEINLILLTSTRSITSLWYALWFCRSLVSHPLCFCCFLLYFEAFLLLGPPILLQFLIFSWLSRWVAPALCLSAPPPLVYLRIEVCFTWHTTLNILCARVCSHWEVCENISQNVRAGRQIPHTPRRTRRL